MLRRFLALCIVTAMSFGSPATAWAQVGGSSAFGNRGFGGMGSFGTGGFSGSGFGNSGLGGSGFGGGGFGSGSGMNGFGGLGNTGFNSTFGMGGTANPFGGSGYGGGQMFVGRDAADMQATFTQMGQAQSQFLNQMSRNMRGNSNRNRRAVQAVENPPQPMRVQIRTAFAVPRLTSTAISAKIQRRLQRLAADHKVGQPTITMQGGTAVIGGVVESESQRLLVERLVMLEPGVREVRNEMTIAAAPSGSSGPSAGN